MMKFYHWIRKSAWSYLLIINLLVPCLIKAQDPIAGIGGFTGSDSPRNVLWLKADAGVTESGGKVSAWADQTGNLLHALQGTGSLQPTYTASNANLNNQPSISFGPTGSANIHLAIPDNSLLDGSSELSYFVILRTVGSGVQGILNKRTGYNANQSYRLFMNGSNLNADISDGGTISSSVSSSSNYLVSTVYDHSLSGNKFFFYRNSTNSTSANVSTSLPDEASPLYIGNFNLSDNRSFEGDIAEILIYRNALTGPQRIIIENQLAEKYVIDLSTNEIFGEYSEYNSSYFTDYRGIGTDGIDTETEATSEAFTIREYNSTLDAGEYIAFAHDNTTHNDGLTSDITVDPGVLDSHWARSWFVEVSESGIVDGGAVSADLIFDFSVSGLTFSGNISDYVLLFRDKVSNDFDRVYAERMSLENGDQIVFTIPSDRMKSGYYTLGEGTQLTSKTWYVFQDGNWSDASTWTLDASTTPIYNNPSSLTPGAEDQVIIRSGKTVTIQGTTNNLSTNSIEVRGYLYLTTSSGHDFSTINGNGQIVLEGSSGNENFPTGTTSGSIGFADPDNGGTLVINGTGEMTLNQARTYKNVLIDRTVGTDKLILAADYDVTGDFTVRNGEFQFGDNSTVSRTLTVQGDVLIEDNGTDRIGSIQTSFLAVKHAFEMQGSFTNNGKVYFTNRTDFASAADRYDPSHSYYNSDDANGLVETTFSSDIQDQTIDCNNTTFFSRIIVDKGVDDTYTLFIQTTDSAYFRLLGRANYNVDSDISSPSSNYNAFALIHGTAKLDNNVIIPVLNTGTNYSVPSNARLWIDGGYVRKSVGAAIVPYGIVEISAGNLIAATGSGVTLREAGKLKVDGGTVIADAFRTSVQGSTAQGTYEQSGGSVLLTGGSGINADYAVFSLTYTGNAFLMSGGTLTIQGRNGLNTDRGTVFINCDAVNQNVTGGTAIFESNTTTEFIVTSTTPFHNVTLRATDASSGEFKLAETTSGTGGGINEPTLAAQPLVALNDLTIEEDAFLNHDGNDVTIGGDFSIDPDARSSGTNNKGYLYDSGNPNVTTFNGTGNSSIYIGQETENGYELFLTNLTISKAETDTLTLTGDPAKEAGNVSTLYFSRLIQVTEDFILESGVFNQGQHSIRLFGTVRLDQQGTLGVYEHGVTETNASFVFRGDGLTIQTEEGATIGNMKMDVDNPASHEISFTSDVVVSRIGYKDGKINMGTYNLQVTYLHDTYSTNRLQISDADISSSGGAIVCAGNASDGGLSLYVSDAVTDGEVFGFPVGVSGKYTPMEATISNVSDDGYITVRPVNEELPTLNGSSNRLQYHWRLDESDFSSTPDAQLVFHYIDSDAQGDETAYVPGRVIDVTTREEDTGVGASVDDSNDIITFSDRILYDGDYTAGEVASFTGTVRMLYARRNGEWFDPNTWSLTEGGSAISGPSELPSSSDIVVIGTSTNNYHVAICDGLNGDDCTGTNYAPIKVAQVSILRKGSGESSILSVDETAAVHDLGFVTHISPDDPTDVNDASKFAVTSSAIPQGDFGEYASAENAMFVFSRRFPANVTGSRRVKDQSNSNMDYNYTSAYTISNSITEFPNIQFEYTGGSSGTDPVTLPDADITVNGIIKFWRSGSYVNYIKFNTSASGGDMTVKGDFTLNQPDAKVEFPATGTARTLTVEGDIDFDNDSDGIFTVEDGGDGSLSHTIALHGDIKNTSSTSELELFRDGAKTAVNLEFVGTGASDMESFNVVPDLNRIIANKDDSSIDIVINSEINLGEDAGSGSSPIELIGGNLILNHANIDIDLTTDGSFSIPAGAELEISLGKANISGDDAGLILDGKLTISGGELDMATGTGNGNNFIEYSSSGNAEIELSSGTLRVGSQLRRSTTSTSGILKYTQTGGSATFGIYTAPETNRGVFEIMNTDSEFHLDIDDASGEEFVLVRENNSTTVASLRLSPDTYSISDGSIITIGNGDTPAAQDDFGIYSEAILKNLQIESANMTTNLYSVPLELDGLNVFAGAAFDAKGFDLTINNSLVNDGSFATSGTSGNNQMTYFPSDAASSISGSGSSNFWNLTKSGTGTLTLSKNVTVDNNAFIYSGTVDTDVSGLYLKKDLIHDATHTSDAAGPGIVFNGTQQQNLDRSDAGTSYFGVVNLDNAAGLIITDTEEDFQINEKLTLTTGVFDIGGNLLIFPEDAFIENGSGSTSIADFNVNRMIQTNSSIKDFGVRKYFPATSGGSVSFTYPVGLTDYTPVYLDLTDISASYITIRPVADLPPIAEDSELDPPTCNDPEIDDSDNVLQYYWIIKSDAVSGMKGSAEMYYDANNISVTSPYTVANYGPARLYNQSSMWDKVFTSSDFDESSQKIVFPFSNNDDATLEGIYTAGVTLENDGTTLLCGAAIPDVVPQYITPSSFTSGNVFDDASYQGGMAPNAGSSFDLVVQSGYHLVYDVSSVRTRRVIIEAGATLELSSGTNNHNLGFVTGEGNLKLVSNTSSISFPTGDYDEFFPGPSCSGGGGLEYAGTGSYTVLSGLPRVRNVLFSGSGDRSFPNNHTLSVCENLEILETVDLTIPDGGNTVTVYGNIYKSDASTFDNGGGSSGIVLAGSSTQYIQGDFSGSNGFNDLEFNNASNVSIINSADASRGISSNADVDVEGQMTFTAGLLLTDDDNTLRLRQAGSLSGYSSTRYINGPFTRELPNNTQVYEYPVGKGGRYGYIEVIDPNGGSSPKDWKAEYFSGLATSHPDVDNMNPTDPVEIIGISGNEYWVIDDNTASGGGENARIGLGWNPGSDVSSDPLERETLVVVAWNGTSWDGYGGQDHAGTTSYGTLNSEDPISFSEKVITLGSESVSNPLPVELVSFTGKEKDGTIELRWETASELNNDYFLIEHSVDGSAFTTVGEIAGAGTVTVTQYYSFIHRNPAYPLNYYRLKQVDYDGAFEYSELIAAALRQKFTPPSLDFTMYPNPTNTSSVTLQLYHLDLSNALNVSVVDLSGMLVSQRSYDNLHYVDEIQLDLGANAPKGVYIVKLSQAGSSVVKKLIVK